MGMGRGYRSQFVYKDTCFDSVLFYFSFIF